MLYAMKNEEIMKEIINFSEKNFVTFSDKRIEEIKKVLEKVKLQMMESIGKSKVTNDGKYWKK